MIGDWVIELIGDGARGAAALGGVNGLMESLGGRGLWSDSVVAVELGLADRGPVATLDYGKADFDLFRVRAVDEAFAIEMSGEASLDRHVVDDFELASG